MPSTTDPTLTRDSAIVVENLQKTFHDGLLRRRPIRALDGVSFHVERGSIFGLLGPNGAGKTTLIKVLLGLVSKSGGQASLLGRSAGDRAGRRQVGYLPEHHRIPRHLTGSTALQYYGGLSGMSRAEVMTRSQPLLERVGLGRWGKTSVRKYSKGMLQRLGLAQAMLHNPEVLILDEPTDGVDPVGRREMRQLLYELKAEGKTVFLNSHLLQEVELVCDRVAIMTHGQLRHVGSVDELQRGNLTDVEMRVAAREAQVRAAVGENSAKLTEDAANQFTDIRLSHPTQQTVNEWIDQLRSHRIDIISVRPQRNSLEDAFVELVAPKPK
jgi:ABC-2 type transport system ATP-binding protein